jgi:type VI secretion system protein ImpK
MTDLLKQLDLVELTVEFYEIIANIKQLQQHGLLDNEVKRQLDLPKAPLNREIAYAVQLKLLHWMENTRADYKDKSTETENHSLESALYVMAALADEIMLINFDWPGKVDWQDMLLENTLFQSSQAGSAIFRDINRLLKAKIHPPLDKQLAAVYLLVLRLGFMGKYRENAERIEEYRQKLYRLIDKNTRAAHNPICHEAYDCLLNFPEQQRLAPLSRWYRIMGVISIAHIIIGFVAWLSLSASVETNLKTIWAQEKFSPDKNQCELFNED